MQTFAKLEDNMLLNTNTTLPENISENTRQAFNGGRSKMSANNKVAIITRKKVIKANDAELHRNMAKKSITEYTKDNAFFDKIGIDPIGESENICSFFKRFNDVITSCEEEDRKDLNQQIINSYQDIEETNKMFNSLMLPRQIMLGIMLNALNNAGEDINKFSKKLNLPQRTCYQYMNAANVVRYIEQDCVYNLGMMVLAGLGKFFKDNEEKIVKSEQNFDTIIRNYMDSPLEIGAGETAEFEKEYNKRVAYFYYQHGFFGNCDINEDEFKELYNLDYKWTFREANRIKEAALAPKKEGSRNREINDSDGVNNEIRNLIAGLSGDTKVYKNRRSIDISCKNGVKALTTILSNISDFNDLSEENRDNLKILQKQMQECQEKLDFLLNKNPEG